ncbi:MAG: HesA/MoeB/ThiF family protein [Porticoccaceae bacterium]
MLSGKDFIRYSRQIMLEDIGEPGQEKLAAASALIIGIGGLGCPVAQYLAAAGIGKLILVDDDKVEQSNLHRQILYTESQTGQPKVEAAKTSLQKLNSSVEIASLQQRATAETLPQLIADADIILDCSDNLVTRLAINRAACFAGKPLVIGSAIRMEVQVISFDFSLDKPGCYACLLENIQEESFDCSTAGVLGPIPGIAASMQALSAIKAIVGSGFITNLWQCFDGRQQKWLSINHSGNPDCDVCARR